VRRRRRGDGDHARHARRGAPVEHAAARSCCTKRSAMRSPSSRTCR
jgi:hypothetical protein